MIFSESLLVALRALRANKLRSLLTILGLIVGVAAVTTMMAVGAGAQQRVIEQIRSLGSNLLLVLPGSATSEGARLGGGTRQNLTESDATTIRNEIPFVVAAAPSVYGRAQAVRGNNNWQTSVQGITLDFLVARDWGIHWGRGFSPTEVDAGEKVALIGQTVVERLFPEEDPVDQVIRIDRVPFIIVGVLKRKGQTAAGADQDDKIFVPLAAAKSRLFGSSRRKLDSVHYIMVKVSDAHLLDEGERQVTALLRQRHGLLHDAEDDFTVRNLAELQEKREEASGTLTRLLVVVALVSLVVGGISIMNIMLVSVTERTREIGLRLAVGARQRDIRVQFMIEAVTLSSLGGVMGIVLGVVASVVISHIAGWPILIRPSAIALAFTFAAMVGVFFGYFPAEKAARLDPIEALRFE